jgi:hypothetical protein
MMKGWKHMKQLMERYHQLLMRSSCLKKLLFEAFEGENIPPVNFATISQLLWFLVRAVNSEEAKVNRCRDVFFISLTGSLSSDDIEIIRDIMLPGLYNFQDRYHYFRYDWLDQGSQIIGLIMKEHREPDDAVTASAMEELGGSDSERALRALSLLEILVIHNADAVAPLYDMIMKHLASGEISIWHRADIILSKLAASSHERAQKIAERLCRVIRDFTPAEHGVKAYRLFTSFLGSTLLALEKAGINLEKMLYHLTETDDRKARSAAFQILSTFSSLSPSCRAEMENCLREDLGSPDPMIRSSAMEALVSYISERHSRGYEPDRSLYRSIVSSLRDSSADVRYNALDCLTEFHLTKKFYEKKTVSWCKSALSDSDDNVRRLAARRLIELMKMHPFLGGAILNFFISRLPDESDRSASPALKRLLEMKLPEKYRLLCFEKAISAENFAQHYGRELCGFVSRSDCYARPLFAALTTRLGSSDSNEQSYCIKALLNLASAIPAMTEDVVNVYSLLLSQRREKSDRDLSYDMISAYGCLADRDSSLRSAFTDELLSEIDEWAKSDCYFKPAEYCLRSRSTAIRFLDVLEAKLNNGTDWVCRSILAVLGKMATDYSDLKDRIRDLCFSMVLPCSSNSRFRFEPDDLRELLLLHPEWKSSFRESVAARHCREWNRIIGNMELLTGITLSYRAEEQRTDEKHILLCISSYLIDNGFISVSGLSQMRQRLSTAVREICRYGRKAFSPEKDLFTGKASRMLLSINLVPQGHMGTIAGDLFTSGKKVIDKADIELLNNLCREHPDLRPALFPYILEAFLRYRWWGKMNDVIDLLSADMLEPHTVSQLIAPILNVTCNGSEYANYRALQALARLSDLLDDRGFHLIPRILDLLEGGGYRISSATWKLLSQICSSTGTELFRESETDDRSLCSKITAGGIHYNLIRRSGAPSAEDIPEH